MSEQQHEVERGPMGVIIRAGLCPFCGRPTPRDPDRQHECELDQAASYADFPIFDVGGEA